MERCFDIKEQCHCIKAKLYYKDLKNIKRVILVAHGFGGSKNNKNAEKFANKALSKYKDVAIMTFNLPCHGDDVTRILSLDDCQSYIEKLVSYIQNEYKVNDIYGYANSFGAYLYLKYIAQKGMPFVKVALRCPAINMYVLMSSHIMTDENKKLLSRGRPINSEGSKIGIDQKFLDDLSNFDVRNQKYIEYADDIILLHGTKDEVIPIEETLKFSEENVIEVIQIENADHRFRDPKLMDFTIHKILEFFDL